MKPKHLIFTLLALLTSMTASAYEWTDANGTVWTFETSGSTANIYKGYNTPAISGTIPADLMIPATLYIGETPYTVTSIESAAFYNCSSLTSVTIPEGVTSIGLYAFNYCSSLSSINIPSSVTSIKGNAFSYCSSLTSVTIPEGVTSIEGAAFCNCSSLTSVNIPEGVTSIGDDTFSGCSSLTSINIPEGVTSIGQNAFCNCSSLTSVTIPEGVTSIGWNAFMDCSSLTSVNIPSSVTSIKGNAFQGCSSLTSVNIPESVTSIGNNAFGGNGMLVNFVSTTPCTLSGDLGDGGTKLVVPHEALTAYREAWPNSANYIVDASLMNQIVDVTAKADASAVIEAIGEEHAQDVVTLKVKGTFNSYDLMVFRNKMTNLMHLDLSEANVVASTYKYYGSYNSEDNIITGSFAPANIVSLKLPKDITALEFSAFRGCSLIKTMELPEGITSIPDYAFSSCSGLTSVIIPESVTTIGFQAFSSCSSLRDIRLPMGLKSIGELAFKYCSGLTELHLPPYLESIEGGAFSGCDNLKTIYAYMPNIITIANYTFGNYTTSQLYIPEFLYNNYYYDTGWSQFININKTTLSPDDYLKLPTNSDITMAEDDQRIPETSAGTPIDGEINTQGSFTVEGDEPQAFNEVEQILDGEGKGGSLIGEDDGEQEGNLTVNTLHVKINVKAGRWYFFCFPYDVTIANCEYPGQYAWRYYDGAYRASNGSGGWKPVTGGTLTALEGYAFQTSHTGNLIISFNHPTFGGDRPKPLNSYISGNAANASWNLVGNPYSSFYDFLDDTFLSPITVFNSSTGSYQAYRPGDDECHLQPYEAFFVQKPIGVDLINFTPDNRESYRKGQEKKSTRLARRRARGINPDRRLINLQLMSGEQETDRTRVVLNEQKSRDYELDCDASKFLSADAQAQLYTVENGTQMAINERPLAGDIRLGYTAKTAGTLSISAPRMDLPMMLVDTKLGITFDLSVGTYEFQTQAGTFNDRFMLSLSSEATAIMTMKEKTGVCFGTQDGGIAIGGAEGKTVSIYTSGGAMAAQHSGNGFIALKSGVYVVNVDGVTAKVSVK